MYRARSLVPRLCRQIIRAQEPSRMKSDVPMFRWGRGHPRDFWGFPSQHFDAHFRDMMEGMDKFASRFFDNYGPAGRTRLRWDPVTRCEAEVKYDEKLYRVKLDVRQFEPEHLNVKIKEDRLIISAKHEQKADDHGYVSREMTREFLIPENIDSESFTSVFTDEGMLVIQGRPKGYQNIKEKVINIEREAPKEENSSKSPE